MSNEFDINKLWNQQVTMPAPDQKFVLKKALDYKKKTRLKIILSNLILLATAAFIIFIGITYHPQMITTKLGIILVVIAIVAFIIASGSRLQVLFKTHEEYSSHVYLLELIYLKQKQDFLQKTMMTFYYIVLSAGIYLYMIECTMQMSLPWAIFAYSITTAWFAFNWFYIRPKATKKQQAVLNEMIEKLQSINQQFQEV